MDQTAFCYWLQGFFEMTDADILSKKQVRMIKEHLQLVFEKRTSQITNPTEDEKTEDEKKIIEWISDLKIGHFPTSITCTASPIDVTTICNDRSAVASDNQWASTLEGTGGAGGAGGTGYTSVKFC